MILKTGNFSLEESSGCLLFNYLLKWGQPWGVTIKRCLICFWKSKAVGCAIPLTTVFMIKVFFLYIQSQPVLFHLMLGVSYCARVRCCESLHLIYWLCSCWYSPGGLAGGRLCCQDTAGLWLFCCPPGPLGLFPQSCFLACSPQPDLLQGALPYQVQKCEYRFIHKTTTNKAVN